ncbi:MAG: hypothetical protein ACREDW_01615 [Aestuariivirgaceae bacterium]
MEAGDRNAGSEASKAATLEGRRAAATINKRAGKEGNRDFPCTGSAVPRSSLLGKVSARKSSETFVPLPAIGENENPLVCKEMTSTSLTRTVLPLQDAILEVVPSEVR